MSTVISQMLVRIAADTAQMRSEMQSAQNAVGSAVGSIKNTVMGLVGTIGSIALAQKFIEVADAVTLMDARLKLAVGGGKDFAKAQQDIYNISQEAGVGLEETASLYTKLYEPVKRLGGGIKENTAIVQAFSASLKVGGASTQEAAAATMQFAQAMGSGKLQGDEFRSIAEASPRFMKALADGMGVPIEQLKKLGSEGKLTADVVGNALMKSLGQLKSEMGSIPDTFGAAAQRFKNDVTKAIGELNTAAGTTLGLAGAVEEARKLIPAVKDELAGAFKAVSDWIDRNREGLGESWDTTKSLLGDVWEVVKAFGRVVGFVAELLVQSGTLKTVIESLRLIVAGLGDGVEFVAAVFTKAGALLLDFVGLFSDSAKSAAQAAHAAADATFKKFGEGKTRVMELNNELANNAAKTAQAKDALAAHGLTAAENSSEMSRLRGRTAAQSGALATLKNANAEATEEQKKAAEALKKATEAGKAYGENLSQQIGSLQKQITLGRELTEAEKEHDKLTEQLRTGKVKLTEADEAGTRAKIDLIGQLKEEIAQKKELEKTMAAVAAASTKYEQALFDETDQMRKANVELREQNEKAGLNTQQLAAREAALLRQQAEEKEWSATMYEEGSGSNWSLKEQARLLRERADMVEQGAIVKEAKAAAEEWAKTTKSIEDGLTNAIMNGLESGKGLMDSLKDYFKNAFKDFVATFIVRPIMAPIAGAMNSIFSGNAMAGTGAGSGGSIMSSIGNFLNGNTINNALGGQVAFGAEGLGNWLVNNTSGSLNSLGGSLMGNAGTIGNIAGMAGNAFAGYGIGKALSTGISGGYSVGKGYNTFQDIGMAVGSAIGGPVMGAIIGAATGLVNRAFGRKAKEMKDYGLEGSITGGDATGRTYQDWFQKGGWFRSNKSGTDYSAMSDDMAAAIDLGAKGVLEQTKAWASALNLPAESLAKVTANFKVKLTQDEKANQDAINLIFEGYSNALTKQFEAVLTPFQKAGEKLSETMARLTALKAFSESINEFGGIFSRVAGASLAARENIIALAGGIDQLMAKAGQFVKDYYTTGEQAGLQARDTLALFESLGISGAGITNREDFRKLVESIDVSTEAGQKQLVALLDIAPTFAALADYIKDQKTTLEDVAKQAPAVAVLDRMLPEQMSTTDAVTDVAERIKEGNAVLASIESAIKSGNTSIATGLAALAAATQTVADLQARVAANTAATARAVANANADAALASSAPSFTYDIGADLVGAGAYAQP